MTTALIADPFASPHNLIVEQLEPFCDLDLVRFTDHELLDAYDLAVTWTAELSTADAAAMHIAAEWLVRHGRCLPRFGSDLESSPFAELSAQFDSTLAALD